jgi:transcriptional regulator with XRE-family HTH domain
MIVRDRKKLATLMVIREVSQRDLAAAIGWKSHSYLGRVLRGEVKSMEAESALRIAHFFGVPVDDLFLTKVSSSDGQPVQPKAGNAA